MTPHISSLHTYPVKSGKGLTSSKYAIVKNSLPYDREFLLVDEKGLFLSQRSIPELALLRAEVGEATIHLSFQQQSITLETTSKVSKDVTVWKDTVNAQNLGEITDFLQPLLSDKSKEKAQRVYLARGKPTEPRYVKKKYSHNTANEITFNYADSFPLLITSTSSLEALNKELIAVGADPVPMSRFRPNIVIDGWPPFYEDRIESFKVGDTTIYLPKPCGRCIMTTIDQTTGIKVGPEPFKSLGIHRSVEKGVMFGWLGYAIAPPNQNLAVGDTIDQLSLLPSSRLACKLTTA